MKRTDLKLLRVMLGAICSLAIATSVIAVPSAPRGAKPKPTATKRVDSKKNQKGGTAQKSATKPAAKPAAPVAKQTSTPVPAAKPALTPGSTSTVAPDEANSPLKRALGSKGGKDDVPVYIRSDNFQLDSKNRVFHYRENVEITKGDLVITADHVAGKYNQKDELEEVDCRQNVVITRGDQLRATSDHAIYYVKTGKIVLTEGPELNDRGNVLSADRVIVYVDEDRSEAEGNVRVKVSKSEGQLDVESAIKRGEKTPTPAPQTGTPAPAGTPNAPTATPGASQ